MLKDKTSPSGRAKKVYILKFKHIELAIDEHIHLFHSKFWG